MIYLIKYLTMYWIFKILTILKKTCKTFNQIITKLKIKILKFNIIYKKSISINRITINICVNTNCSNFSWNPYKFYYNGTIYIPYCFNCAKKWERSDIRIYSVYPFMNQLNTYATLWEYKLIIEINQIKLYIQHPLVIIIIVC